MKNIIIFLFIFIFCSTVFAEEYFDLEWSDIAPKRYENIQENKFYFTGSARYWSYRKAGFEKRLQFCKNLGEEEKKEDCLNQLLQRETLYTNRHYEEDRSRMLKKLLIFSAI